MTRQTCMLLLSLLICNTAIANSNDTWSTYQGNGAHTGYVNVTVRGDAIKPLWTHELQLDAKSKFAYLNLDHLIVSNHSVFIIVVSLSSPSAPPDFSQQMLALDVTTGDEQWKVDFDEGHVASGISFADNKLYLFQSFGPCINGESNISIESYDATTGNKIYSSPNTFGCEYSGSDQSPVIDNNQLFLGQVERQLAVNISDGKTQWKSDQDYAPDMMPVVNNEYVMRANAFGDLVLLDRKTGGLVNTIKLDSKINDGSVKVLAPLVWDGYNNSVYAEILMNDGYPDHASWIVAFDPQAKTVKWSLNLPWTTMQLVTSDNVIYIVDSLNDKSTLTAINSTNGAIIWTQPLNYPVDTNYGYFITPPILIKNAVIVPTTQDIEIFSRDTHQLMKSIPVAGKTKIAAANNVLYYTEQTSAHELRITALELNWQRET